MNELPVPCGCTFQFKANKSVYEQVWKTMRRHYISIRFWKVPIEAAILFAGSRLDPSKTSSSMGLFVSHDCKLFY